MNDKAAVQAKRTCNKRGGHTKKRVGRLGLKLKWKPTMKIKLKPGNETRRN